jgi:ABC-type uncharacterized transport system fused permease/ATPase subunit
MIYLVWFNTCYEVSISLHDILKKLYFKSSVIHVPFVSSNNTKHHIHLIHRIYFCFSTMPTESYLQSTYLKNFVEHMTSTPKGKRALGCCVLLLLLGGKKALTKNSDTKYITNVIPSSVDTTHDRNIQKKKPSLIDYIRILKRCQDNDKKVYPIIALYTVVLVSRIIATTMITTSIAKVAKLLAKKDWKNMFDAQYGFVISCIPAMLLTGAQLFLEKIAETRVFTSLASSMTKQYFSDNRFYKITNTHIDNIITHDTMGFAKELMESFNGFVKPSVDIMYLSFVLGKKIGYSNIARFYGYFGVASYLLSFVKIPFSKLIKHKMSLESDFRSNLHRSREYVEPIAFLNGAKTELEISNNKLMIIKRYSNRLALCKMIPDMLDAFFIKYGGMMAGFISLAPTVYSTSFDGDASDITEYYTLVSNLMTTVGKTIIDLISVQRSVYNLDGFTSRICETLRELDSIKNENQTDTKNDLNTSNSDTTLDKISINNVQIIVPKKYDEQSSNNDNININTSNSILIDGLTLDIGKNDHLVITGNNGTGKTSLIRTLAGLWNSVKNDHDCKTKSGQIYLPSKVKFIPQKPYFTIDTFYKSVGYPKINITNQDILSIDELIVKVGLSDVISRYDKSEIIDWMSVLSGGEKQRLAIVRALYDNPDYCIMDEATSAMSTDIEESIFELFLNKGVTIVSIVHRDSLKKFHKRELKLLGNGNWICQDIV